MQIGPVLDIDKQLALYREGRVRNRVYRIGVELEGGWDKLPSKTRVVRDGSIVFPEDQPYPNIVGELAGPPISLGELSGWMNKFYPPFHNETCGMHVHMSFKTAMTYQRLMTPEYPATIVSYMEKWSKENKLSKTNPIWERLAGNSRFCKHQFFADMQASVVAKDYDNNRQGNRYTVINYCFSRHNTLECRLLPMMPDTTTAISAINEVIAITNAFLLKTVKREEKYSLSIVDEEVEINRVRIEL